MSVVPGTLFARLVRSEPFRVNTLHRQAVRDMGERLVPSAFATDGVVEAAEVPDRRFAIGVQYRPEYLGPGEPGAREVFERLLVEACGGF